MTMGKRFKKNREEVQLRIYFGSAGRREGRTNGRFGNNQNSTGNQDCKKELKGNRSSPQSQISERSFF